MFRIIKSSEERKLRTCVHECGHELVTVLLFGWDYVKSLAVRGKDGDYDGKFNPDWEQLDSICEKNNSKRPTGLLQIN